MNFIDLAAQQNGIRDEINRNMAGVLNHGKYIMGPEVPELEEKLASYLNVQHGVACSSGTDALLMALMAYGVGPGDAIFTTPFTFVATAEIICLLGATPVFVDVEESTFNIDPTNLSLAIKATQGMDNSVYPLPYADPHRKLKPRGIIAVDLFGLPANYHSIGDIAKTHDLFVIGDAAQSFCSEYKGVKAGSLSDVTCTYFFPAKPLGCYGDGGMCFTNDGGLAGILQSIRVHGKGSDKYDNVRIGINGRLDTLQAAILLAKMEIFDKEITMRQQVADRYNRLLEDQNVETPHIPAGYKSMWAQYSLLAESDQDRDHYMTSLRSRGIPSVIYYPKPLHLQTAFQHLAYQPGNFSVSESLANRIFSLPMHPYLTEDDQLKVVRALSE